MTKTRSGYVLQPAGVVAKAIIKRSTQKLEPRMNFEVVNLRTRKVVGYDTIEEARGAIAFDGLRTDWEIWQTGRDILVDYRDSGRY